MANQFDKTPVTGQGEDPGQMSGRGGTTTGSQRSAKKSSSQSTMATPNQTASSSMSTSGTSERSVTDTAKSLLADAKTTAGDAYGAATEKAATKLDEKKADLSAGLTTVADSVRKASENLHSDTDHSNITDFTAKYADTAAEKIDDFANYFERKNVREMADDLQEFARRHPAWFIGGAAAIGLIAARFLKSSAPRDLNEGRTFESDLPMPQPERLPESFDRPQAKQRSAGAGRSDVL